MIKCLKNCILDQPMSDRIVKRTYNLPRDLADYASRLADANALSETEVIKSGLKVLRMLGDIGVGRSFVVKAVAEGDRDKEILLLGLDLSAATERVSDTEPLPKGEQSATIEPKNDNQ